jgi:hypothetical protein
LNELTELATDAFLGRCLDPELDRREWSCPGKGNCERGVESGDVASKLSTDLLPEGDVMVD